MPRGGKRPGAGRRKTKQQFERLQALAAQAITDETWIKVLKGLAEEAEYGNVRCAELLFHYAFGISPHQPKPSAQPTTTPPRTHDT